MGKIVALLLGLGVFLAFIFGGLIYPIWMIVHCANSQRNGGKKTLWIIFMILIWPITSLIYGLFASGRRLFQWISVIYLLGGIAFLFMMISGVQWSSKFVVQQTSNTIANIGQMNTDGLTPENIKELKNDLNTLLGEVQTSTSFNMYRLKDVKPSFSLLELFDTYTKDNRITPTEYADWIYKFKARAILDDKALRRQIRSLRGIKIM